MTVENNDTGNVDVRAAEAETFSYNVEPNAQVLQSRGVLASARPLHGATIAGRAVNEKDIVKVGSVELSVEQALNSGFLARDGNGKIIDVSADEYKRALNAPRAAAEERAKAEAETAIQEYGVGMEPENARAMGSIVQEVEQIGVNPASALQEFIGNPDRLPEALKLVAKQKGRDEGAELQRLRSLAQDMTVGVEDLMITKGGFDPAQLPAFWEWARTQKPFELRAAALAAVLKSDGRQYLRLADQFQFAFGRGRGVSPYPVSTIRMGQTEVQVIDHPKYGRMRLDAARRLGIA